jgi:hypothetical protein
METTLPGEPQVSPWKLLCHFATGTTVFVVIALLAVGLSLLVEFLFQKGINSVIVMGLKGAEYLLFVTDLFLFAVFVGRTAWRTFGKL